MLKDIAMPQQYVDLLSKDYTFFNNFLVHSSKSLSRGRINEFQEELEKNRRDIIVTSYKSQLRLPPIKQYLQPIIDNPKKFHYLMRLRKSAMQAVPLFNRPGSVELEHWIMSRLVKVYNVSNPSFNNKARKAVEGIQARIHDLGLNFDVVFSQDNQLRKEYHTSFCKNNILQIEQYENQIANRRKSNNKDRHADILFTNSKFRFPEDMQRTENYNIGYGNFKTGCVFFAFDGNAASESDDFIFRLAFHEAGHLFGMYNHHDIITTANEFKCLGEGISDCSMLPSCSTLSTCFGCQEWFKFFWWGIEQKNGLHGYFLKPEKYLE